MINKKKELDLCKQRSEKPLHIREVDDDSDSQLRPASSNSDT